MKLLSKSSITLGILNILFARVICRVQLRTGKQENACDFTESNQRDVEVAFAGARVQKLLTDIRTLWHAVCPCRYAPRLAIEIHMMPFNCSHLQLHCGKSI